MDPIWQRVCDGRHVAVIGTLPELPPDPPLFLVRVDCDEPHRPLGALLEARERVEQLLDWSPHPLIDHARQRVRDGLRRRLLGEMMEKEPGAAFVDSLNRLAKQQRRPSAVIFDRLESADAVTLQVLHQILVRVGWLRMPLVLQFRTTDIPEGARALLEVLQQSEGEMSVHRRTATLLDEAEGVIPEDLAPDARRVLRAASVVGEKFDVGLVASLLEQTPLNVLYLLQVARDEGVPITDLGDGRFRLPASLVASLSGELMASLSNAWHRRLARILAERARTERPPAPKTIPPGARAGAPRPTVSVAQKREVPGALRHELPSAPRHELPPGASFYEVPSATRHEVPSAARHDVPSAPWYDIPSAPRHETPSAPWHEPPSASRHDAPGATQRPERRSSAPVRRPEPTRAARHAEAAGDVDLAVEQYVAAAHEAARQDAHSQAAEMVHKALSLLGDAPRTSRRRMLRVMALLELARLKWQAAVPGEPSGLSDAMELLGECKSRLLPSDPVDVRAEVASVRASVCYDIGDKDSLDLALAELAEASRAFLDAGRPLDAARLLNDEAAVWVRAGDPVRANHLLQKSREIFAARADQDLAARLQLAETDHLLARIVLHAQPRPGHAMDALDVGIEHAHRAERVLSELDRPRELARVWETLGRLEMGAGLQREAMQHLVAAADVQQQVLDVLGLARTSAALAEIAKNAGDYTRALGLIAGSVELNLEKGSPLGLAFNRGALLKMTDELDDEQRRALGGELAQVVERLEAAENVLGRAELPPDALGPGAAPADG